ncbi:hypothetical protein UA08_09211 [Talaromyces atroroseus]|uniref:Zn(2)-C6 fungal-type domain-containing protein n=1 Tax=Talaromyces atroroseus TaxID=1441469 RepID=A0A1Q5Q6Q3_TALAT|nr:hypothetical protein UA08_09211 [Talaromyces atroroseus]OKL55522.1 hypothetical protein UA08_09211 [Talaromyces atroroseus]
MESTANPRRSLRPIKRACVDCHARKVRCDGAVNGFPCSNCRSVNIECAIVARRKRVRGPARSRQAAANRSAEGVRSLDVGQTLEIAPTSPVNQDSEGNDAPQSGADGEDELAKQHLVNFFGQNLQETPIRTRLAYVGSELANLNYLVRQRSANHNVYHYPCSNTYIPRVQKISQGLTTPSLIPKDAFIIPPKHISDVLVAAYFEDVHPSFPIVDKDRFLTLYDEPRSVPSLLLLQAICLVGSHVTAAFKNNQDFKVSFFRRAKALFDGRYEEDRMEMVQAALLLTWFSDGGDDICANAWWWIGVASRTAIGLGMHREVGPSKMPDADKKTWKRMWWCLVQFDCLVSLCYGRPQNINLDDCDVPALTPEDFDASEGTREANFVIYHSELCALVSRLVQSHFSLRAIKTEDSRRERLDAVDASLAQWLANLPLEFRQDAALRPSKERNPWPLLLHLTFNTVLVLFHRSPVASRAGSDTGTDGTADEEICYEATSNIVRIFERLDQQSSLRLCCFWTPSPLFTALLHLRGQLRYKNPILAMRANEKYQSGMQSLRKLSQYWLFASSVWRLFESISTKDILSDATIVQAPQGTIPLEEISPNSYAGTEMNVAEQAQPRESEWAQVLTSEEPLHGRYTAMDQYRWQDHLSEWHSLYWSDPLASMRLQEDFGEYLLEEGSTPEEPSALATERI